jgi:1-acyl-sn-glycerol-3-phosphate acyltransferase
MNLLRNQRFAPLFLAQVAAAFVDNLVRASVGWWALVHGGWGAWGVVLAANAAFVLPFAVLSGTAGQLADSVDRARIAVFTRLVAFVGVAFAVWGLVEGNLVPMLLSAWILGINAAIFGPAKYAVLEDLVGADDLLGANAWVQGSTYLAILGGTFAGLAVGSPTGDRLVAAVAVGGAGLAVASAFALPVLDGAGTPVDLDPLAAGRQVLGVARGQLAVWRSLLGLAWFWVVGEALVGSFPAYARELSADLDLAGFLLAVWAVGIAVGAWACVRLSRDRLELGVVPIGTAGMTLFLLDLSFASPAGGTLGAFLHTVGGWRVTADLLGISFSAALLAVPLQTLLQTRTPPDARGRVIGAYNLVTGLAMAGGAVVGTALLSVGVPLHWIYGALALAGAAVAWATYRAIPDFMLRFWAWCLSNVVYRVAVEGAANLPSEGPVVIVVNHVSFIDWLIVMGAVKRPARFVMYKAFFEMPVVRVLFEHAHSIPIAGAREDPEALDKAMDAISAELRAGEVVVIFPEGSLTPDGEIHGFRQGIERIIARDPVPVVPMALNGLWGSFFSRYEGKAFRRPFRRVWSRIWLTIEPPIPPAEVSAAGLEAKVRAMWDRRGRAGQP